MRQSGGASTNARRAARKLRSTAIDPLGGEWKGKKPNATELADLLGMDPRAAEALREVEHAQRRKVRLHSTSTLRTCADLQSASVHRSSIHLALIPRLGQTAPFKADADQASRLRTRPRTLYLPTKSAEDITTARRKLVAAKVLLRPMMGLKAPPPMTRLKAVRNGW